MTNLPSLTKIKAVIFRAKARKSRLIKAVIFDMDGLLIDSEPIWTETDRRLLARYGQEYVPEDKARFMGSGVKEFIKRIKERFSLVENEEELLKERMEIFRNLLDQRLKLMPGAEDLVKKLTKKGYLLALATGNSHQMMELIVKKTNLEKYFPVQVSSDEVPHGKPAPDTFLEAARRLKVQSEECLVLEDAINGILAAQAAGMKSIAVCDQRFNKPESFTEADMVVGSLWELNVEMIESLI